LCAGAHTGWVLTVQTILGWYYNGAALEGDVGGGRNSLL